jgi:hypothetical protein
VERKPEVVTSETGWCDQTFSHFVTALKGQESEVLCVNYLIQGYGV